MKMTASTRIVDGVTIVDLRGRLVLGEESAGLRDLVRNLASRGNKKILLNLRDVSYIDSSGLGELVSAFTNMRSLGGELKLLNLNERVHDLLQITKLYTIFDITDDEATSVKSFLPVIWPPPQPIAR
jgi:anti-sigma B factor antagonist